MTLQFWPMIGEILFKLFLLLMLVGGCVGVYNLIHGKAKTPSPKEG